MGSKGVLVAVNRAGTSADACGRPSEAERKRLALKSSSSSSNNNNNSSAANLRQTQQQQH